MENSSIPALPSEKRRIHSIDILRGIIMVIMALDHTRDFFSDASYDPLDLSQTTPQLFFTRWITHFCAPIFVFLAGTSAFLSSGKFASKGAASAFLLKRGIWIIFLELVIINLSWTYDIHYAQMLLQVFWAIGWSMIFLAGLVWLPLRGIAITGLAILLFHNTLDAFEAPGFERSGWLWMMLHQGGYMPLSKTSGIIFGYPILPWVGVMATGYAFGTIYKKETAIRRKWLISIGLSCILLFILLRFSNLYGDRTQSTVLDTGWKTLCSFVNCTKYPPSLQYLLMTLGPGILILGLLEQVRNKITDFFEVYGKVPMFYYLLHVPVIHTLALCIAMAKGADTERFFHSLFFAQPDPNWGFGLPVVYLVWMVVVLLLYFPCRWYMQLKVRRNNWWLSYL